MYYTQEQIDRANQADLVSFLQSQGEQLTRAGNEYRWKRHDSMTIRGNKWYRHSQSKGGGPVDFVMEFFGKSFTEAVELLTGEQGAAAPDRPSPAPLSDFRLPPRSDTAGQVKSYLTEARRIDKDVTGFFLSSGDIYEEAAHHNAVFVGRDEDGVPRYAHQRGTARNFRLDVKGSDKAFNFCYRGEGERLFVFEAPIDLLSFLCLFKKDWQKQSYLALGGVGEKALLRFLSDRPNIKTVFLCLDSDEAGNDACSRLAELVPEGLTVHRLVPLYKDWNEVQTRREEITDGKYLREAVYGLKEPPQEETVEIIRMSEVDTQTVEWLWEPYIPFGKVTIVQGNPGEGKTTFALRLAAACTNRKPFPHMAAHEPFNVIYQTAEDGLGDTIKPRLMEAEADLDRVLVIDESNQGLSLSDERIERAIRQTGARLIILDPIQAYVGEKTDMNKANEIRPMFRRLADVAERTGCAVILIGHLNKAAGGQSAYRGLGSIDFRAAARSVLLIGRVKREPNVRVIVHDKSSLAPEGKPVAFCLDPETGFSWIGEYDITADELLSGAGGNTATKTEQAEKLILDLLADGKELASEEIVKAAAEAGISERTVQNAKRNMGDILGARRVGGQWYNFIKKKQQPEPAS
ncbi:AAA family ATPase [Mordavella massiliensis]|uniref:AAA family ATPase n=1 Tax=Mordavella massiliensis TaxID=1871024 RepID=A0A939BF89_9CLOT|nr:AAA family ATPase [Mordavella massiliensis]MBM6947992.1 AAA family ATPase [Mordavella massiliensis]